MITLLVYALLVLYQDGAEWSPKFLLLRIQALLNEALIAYSYELAQADHLGPPPALPRLSA